MTGEGFDENNYSPMPPVGKTDPQQGTTRPTSTPKPMVGTDLNISDPTHNRGKVNRINSFTATQEQVETVVKQSKGGLTKTQMLRIQHILAPAPREKQVSHRFNAPPVEAMITSGRIVMRMSFAQDAEPNPTLQKCVVSQQK